MAMPKGTPKPCMILSKADLYLSGINKSVQTGPYMDMIIWKNPRAKREPKAAK